MSHVKMTHDMNKSRELPNTNPVCMKGLQAACSFEARKEIR